MEQVDIDIKEAVDKANALNKKFSKTIKIYALMALLFFVSFILSLYRTYQADKAYDQAQESLIRYEEGVMKVEKLIELMEERNRILAQQDSINNLAHGDH